jgi:hypothetical protein
MEENRTGGGSQNGFRRSRNSEKEIELPRSLYVYSALINVQLENSKVNSCGCVERLVPQDSHDYVNVAHAWLLSIELLQRSHCGLYDNAIICITLPKLRIIT